MKRSLLILLAIVGLAGMAMANTGPADQAPDYLGIAALAVGALAVAPATLRALGVNANFLGLALVTTITTTDLQTAYGAQYANGSKSWQDLKTKVFESSSFDQLFNVEYTNLTTWHKATATMSAVTQRFQLAFTPSGTLTFKPSKYDLDEVKVDLKLSSHSIKRDFIGFAHKTGVPQTAQEFIKYVVEHVSKQHVEDVELEGAWGGVNATITPGTATNAAGMMDGFRKVINDGITASTIDPIVMGAVPSDPQDFVEYVEEFVKSIPNKYKNWRMTLAMSLTNEEKFKEGMRLKYKTYYDNGTDVMRVYVRPLITVKGEVAMGDSSKIFMSPKDNLYKVVNMGDARAPIFNLETEDRSIKIWSDYLVKYCIWNHEWFFTNDVSLGSTES